MTAQTANSLPRTKPRARAGVLVFLVLLIAAIAVRTLFWHYRSGDFVDYYERWYAFVRSHGGFGALEHPFANYNMPYLYLLAAVSYLPVPSLVAVKLIPTVFDALLGFFVYRLVGLRRPSGPAAPIAAGIVLVLPSIVLNSSMWGQADSTYVALGVGGLYYLVRREHWPACALLGAALAFKLQVVFLFPVLLPLLLLRWLPWRALIAIPAVYLLLDVPALLLGANPRDLLLVYYNQTQLDDRFSVTTPNVYQFLDPPGSPAVQHIGLAVAVAVVLGLTALLVVNRVRPDGTVVLLLALVSVLVIPFLLPKMHERYFYLADVISVVAAFWLPRRLWPVPVLVQFASALSYLPFLLLPYRLRELTGDSALADGSGLLGSGFAEGRSMFRALLGLGGNPLGRLHEIFAPVVDFRVLAAAVLVATVWALVVTARLLRTAPEPFATVAGEGTPP